MKTKWLLPLVTLLLAAQCPPSTPATPPSLPNFAWDGPKTYSTGSSAVPLAGFGVNALVDVLPAGTFPMPVRVARSLKNDGTVAAPAGYTINERVVAMHLVSTGTSVGFLPIAGPDVANLNRRGPALAPGASVQEAFAFVVPGCGLYKETLTADATNIVKETTKADNVATHYFAVPGTMALNLNVAQTGAVDVWHGTSPGPRGAPHFVTIPTAFPYVTHTFTITAATPGTTFFYNYYTKPIVGLSGSTAMLTGPPPVQPPAAPVAGPIVITFQIQTPVTHDNQPMTDILTELVEEQFHAMVTAITADGCFVRQGSASSSLWHPGR